MAASIGASPSTPSLCGHTLRDVWLCPLQAVCHGAVQGLQEQVGPQIHQDKGGDTHWCQEEAKGVEQHPGCHVESGCQKRLSPLLFVHNTFSVEKQK